MPTSLSDRGGISRSDARKATGLKGKKGVGDRPSPFLELRWDDDWDASFSEWSEDFNNIETFTGLLHTLYEQGFDLKVSEQQGRVCATLILRDADEDLGPKLLTAREERPDLAVLCVAYKWMVVLGGKWPQTFQDRPKRTRE